MVVACGVCGEDADRAFVCRRLQPGAALRICIARCAGAYADGGIACAAADAVRAVCVYIVVFAEDVAAKVADEGAGDGSGGGAGGADFAGSIAVADNGRRHIAGEAAGIGSVGAGLSVACGVAVADDGRRHIA